MRATTAMLAAGPVLLSLAACDLSNIRHAEFSAPPAEGLTANVGDTVMDVRIMRPPLSAIGVTGSANSREMWRMQVQFAGVQRGRAVLVRHYLVAPDAEGPPLWTPVGVPSPMPSYVATAVPQSVALAAGEVLPLEGRKLTVRRVGRTTLDYAVAAE